MSTAIRSVIMALGLVEDRVCFLEKDYCWKLDNASAESV